MRPVGKICALALMVLLGLGAQAAERPGDCRAALASAEARYRLPQGLLLAMALVESGHTDPATDLVAPWPWTIQAGGHGYFFSSSAEAIREAKLLLKGGNGYIDVGCLQVDLYHHPEAFPSLEAAFDPTTNVDYAARYLRSLALARGSWLEAIAAYNAGAPAAGLAYLDKVLYLWKGVRLTAGIPGHPIS